MKFFKVETENDVLYFPAESLEHAKKKFKNIFGNVPESILHWKEIDTLRREKKRYETYIYLFFYIISFIGV